MPKTGENYVPCMNASGLNLGKTLEIIDLLMGYTGKTRMAPGLFVSICWKNGGLFLPYWMFMVVPGLRAAVALMKETGGSLLRVFRSI
jgi:hypothetical protein